MKRYLRLIDIFVILIHVTYMVSLVKVVTLDIIPINSTVTLFALMIILYSFRIGNKFPLSPLRRNSFILTIFCLIYIFDIFQCLFRDPPSALVRFFCFVDMYLFLCYIYKVFCEQTKDTLSSIQIIARPYLCFAAYNVVIVIMAAALIFFGIISPTQNELEVNSITKTNVSSGQVYYFPYYISVVTQSMRILADWGIPMVTGLTHEPHVFNYLVLPSLFVLLSIDEIRKYKILVYAIYMVALFVATSTTAVVCFTALFFIDLLWSFFIEKSIKTTLPLLFIVAILLYKGQFVFELLQNELLRKTVEDTGSVEYSANVLEYLLSPTSIFGEGNMPAQFGYKTTEGNVGLITCLLDILFFSSFFFTAIRNVINRNIKIHYLGLACLYIILHSLKISIHIYSYPMFSMFVLILILTDNYRIHYAKNRWSAE